MVRCFPALKVQELWEMYVYCFILVLLLYRRGVAAYR